MARMPTVLAPIALLATISLGGCQAAVPAATPPIANVAVVASAPTATCADTCRFLVACQAAFDVDGCVADCASQGYDPQVLAELQAGDCDDARGWLATASAPARGTIRVRGSLPPLLIIDLSEPGSLGGVLGEALRGRQHAGATCTGGDDSCGGGTLCCDHGSRAALGELGQCAPLLLCRGR